MSWSASFSNNRPVAPPRNREGFVRRYIANYVPRPKRKSKVEIAAEYLKATLEKGEKRQTEIAAGAKIPRLTLNRAKKLLGVRSDRVGGHWWWSLPKSPEAN
jgi:hypothetical protein